MTFTQGASYPIVIHSYLIQQIALLEPCGSPELVELARAEKRMSSNTGKLKYGSLVVLAAQYVLSASNLGTKRCPECLLVVEVTSFDGGYCNLVFTRINLTLANLIVELKMKVWQLRCLNRLFSQLFTTVLHLGTKVVRRFLKVIS